MSDTPDSPPSPAAGPDRFPVATVIATLLGLFLFFGLVLVAYFSPNYLGDFRGEAKTDAVAKLKDVQARNQVVLDGADPSVKLSVAKATVEVLASAAKTKDSKNPQGRLPFPIAPSTPVVTSPTPAEKK